MLGELSCIFASWIAMVKMDRKISCSVEHAFRKIEKRLITIREDFWKTLIQYLKTLVSAVTQVDDSELNSFTIQLLENLLSIESFQLILRHWPLKQ